MRRIRRDEGMDVDPDAEDDEDEEEADEEEEEGTATGTRLTGASGSRGPFDYRFLGGGSGSTAQSQTQPRSQAQSTGNPLADAIRQSAQVQEDGSLLVPHAFFRALFASGLLPEEAITRLAGQLGGDDEDDDDEDLDGEEWDEDQDDEDEDEDDDDDEGYNVFGGGRFRRGGLARNGRLRGWDWFDIEREGKPAGKRLARGGEFGRVGFPLGEDVRTGLALDLAQSESKTRSGSGFRSAGDVLMEEQAEDDNDDNVDDSNEHALSTSPTSTIATHLSRSPTTRTKRPSQTPSQTRRRTSSSSSITLATSPNTRTRRLSASSLASAAMGIEDDGRVKGIKSKVVGRGGWVKGMMGFGKETGRGVWGSSGREEWSKKCLPNTNGTIVASYSASPYIGQHSHDHSFFYTATQDFKLHLYSTQDAPLSRLANNAGRNALPARPQRRSIYARHYDDDGPDDHSLRKIKTVQGVHGQWTVTDADLSRDNEWMIYSSITPYVHLLRTAEHEHEHTMLDFSESGQRGGMARYMREFGIWSIRFSADQKEIIAGAGSGQIMVYDIAAKRRILNIRAHNADVNGVCFADENSTNVIVSASDDGYLKVWDRRSIGSSIPSGVLAGHTEGLTYVDAKGDGRYVVSNGKDQAMRLWDLRRMRSWNEVNETAPNAKTAYGLGSDWDYRSGYYRKPRHQAHPLDCSVMTYRGHHVLSTLIRCHFSPVESTGGQYVYTGGSNGVIWIYHLDGRVVQVLDRTKAQPLVNPLTGEYNDPSAPQEVVSEYDPDPKGASNCTVRDVSWNGNEPSLISTAWERHAGGDIAVHQWKGLGKGGLNRLEDWVEVSAANADAGEGVGDDGRA
ncbi:hypothetical protein FFLO_06365 [Filobasidium floriforme]|uniref:WD40 repeat-like protein n=1 Tax=Filobasidium floriforme TaxID=5210 RepID=A0A8K0NKM3_9TREE|nr:hypothetical protein FFLO_06365 [Filobasidium floriforme]